MWISAFFTRATRGNYPQSLVKNIPVFHSPLGRKREKTVFHRLFSTFHRPCG
jgi:hypothetical protein